jgi:hypothetical protein
MPDKSHRRNDKSSAAKIKRNDRRSATRIKRSVSSHARKWLRRARVNGGRRRACPVAAVEVAVVALPQALEAEVAAAAVVVVVVDAHDREGARR